MGVTMAVGRASTQHHLFQWFWAWFLGLSAMFPSKKSSNLHLEPFGWCGWWAKHCGSQQAQATFFGRLSMLSDSDFAELTSVTKLKHFKRSNHINELTFWGLRFYSISHKVKTRTQKDELSLQNGVFAILWFLEKEWITILEREIYTCCFRSPPVVLYAKGFRICLSRPHHWWRWTKTMILSTSTEARCGFGKVDSWWFLGPLDLFPLGDSCHIVSIGR